nr:sulfotransferase [uncultured Psychroserpens sp.]
MSKKKHKVIIVGLPKTGTSTVTIMLRILGYDVIGPDGDYNKGDIALLNQKFEAHDAFQDYPWCFEWERFLDKPEVKYIILKRNEASWFKSFYESYGRTGARYMSYPFINIRKDIKNKNQFLEYFKRYYNKANQYAENYPKRFLTISIDTFLWEDLCLFLNEPIPKTMFGKPVKKPHINKKYHISKPTSINKFRSKLRVYIVPIIGRKNWNTIVAFLRKNKIYN